MSAEVRLLRELAAGGVTVRLRSSLFALALAVVYAGTCADGIGCTTDPNTATPCEDLLNTSIPSIANGASINDYVGANRFYDAGYTGQNTIVANVEAGLIWEVPPATKPCNSCRTAASTPRQEPRAATTDTPHGLA